MSSSPTYLDPIVIPLIKGETILDVGCGYGRWGNLIQSNFWEAGLTKPPIIEGFDAFQNNVDFCAKHSCYERVWKHTLPEPLTGQWDTVLACEIIEHLAQDEAEKTLDILESVARKRIIFSTPNWPYFRGGAETIVGYNDFEAHLSYISRKTFQQRGYRVYGAGFGNPDNIISRLALRLS
ncbi:MAG TPA: methyltransferase domain-containing protein, partial [Pyrinomonadaceae bacterium]|nr:methyltransferase domain-containing protein [Pyrinomonadaceae bacterium]